LPILLMVASTIGVYLVTCRYGNLSRWMSAFVVSLGAAPVVIATTAQRINGLASALPWNHIMFRGRDSDWLVYQGYARQILLDQSLRGGEATFYFIPGMRYVAFLQHLLLGDSDIIIAVSVFVVLLAATLLLLNPQLSRLSVIPLIVVGSLVATWLRPLILELVTNGAAEPTAWLCVLIGMMPWLTRNKVSETALYWGAGLMGFAVFVRPNLLFAVIVLVFWMLWNENHIGTATRTRILILAVAVLSAAFFHNLHYGESSTAFTEFVTLDRDLTISELIQSPFSSELRAIVLGKISLALSWNASKLLFGTAIIAWITQLVWAWSVVAELRGGRNWENLIVLAVPVVYLTSMLPFRYTTIPGRHFVGLSLLLGISAMATRMHGEKPIEAHNGV